MKLLPKTISLGIAVCCFCSSLYAQTTSSTKPAEEEEQKFSFGNISPVILKKDGIEVSTTHDLSSYWITSKFGSRILDRYRVSRFDGNLNVQYGFAHNKRWDLGAQVKYGRVRLDENSRSSPFKVFSAADATSQIYSGVSAVGLRIRTAPFENNTAFTLQGSILFPIAKDELTRTALSMDRIQTDLVGTYFKSLVDNQSLYLYLQGRYLLQLANKENDRTTHFPGLSVLLVKSLFDQTVFLFPGLSYLSAFQQNYAGGRWSQQSQFLMMSIGAQVQPVTNLSVFINAQRPMIYSAKNNIYSDLVKNSYSDWAVGVRLVL